jgi:hypothetical protein
MKIENGAFRLFPKGPKAPKFSLNSLTMFCGDETGAFVADLGYTNSRFGYGGDPDPKVRHILLFCNYLHGVCRERGDVFICSFITQNQHIYSNIFIRTHISLN